MNKFTGKKYRRAGPKKRVYGDTASRSSIMDILVMDPDFDEIDEAEFEVRGQYGGGDNLE